MWVIMTLIPSCLYAQWAPLICVTGGSKVKVLFDVCGSDFPGVPWAILAVLKVIAKSVR